MNLSINHWANKFAGIITLFSLATALSASAATTATITVSTVGGGTVTPNYNGQNLTVGNQYTLTAKPKGGFIFNGWTGSYASSQAKLSFVLSSDVSLTANFLDTQIPTISIMPILKAWSTNSVSNAVYVVTGTARDNGTIAQVYCKVNNDPWTTANTGNGWSNWWANMTLSPNTNTVLAYAIDSDGNVSKTAQLKITYTASQPNLYNPIPATMVVLDTNSLEVEEVTFSTNTFSDITGVGTYTYTRTGPINGKLMMKYTAPPSVVNATNNVNVSLLYNKYYTGTFVEKPDLTFFLYKTYNWSPPTLTGAKLIFTNSPDGDGINQTELDFPLQPSLGANADLQNAPNPVVLMLKSDYPGQIGDRVNVSFDHKRKQKGVVKSLGTVVNPGTVIDTGSNTVKILFDSPQYTKSQDPFTPVALNIISYYYQNFSGGELVTNGTGTFTFTNYSFVGSLLQLNEDLKNKYVILTFTNDTAAGIYYDETHLPDKTVTTTSGSFELALPPQIVIQPQNVAVTNNIASFSVVAAGTPVLIYQWLFNGTNLTDGLTGTGSTIAGSSTTNLTITGLSLNDFGNYQVVVSNAFGIVTSSNAVLAAAVPPFITTQPQNVSTTTGGNASFSATAGGSQPLGYRWQFNGVNLPNGITPWNSVIQGATTPNLSLSAVTTNETGFYQVVVTNNFGSVTSSVANLNVSP